MKRRITIKEIARELDVSTSTVSKALNHSDEISQDTKDKVQAFAKLFNYRPNQMAVNFRMKRSKNIAVILPDISSNFYIEALKSIEDFANAKGYNTILVISNESFETEVRKTESLANRSIDGIVMSLSIETQLIENYGHLERFVTHGVPLVLFDRTTDKVQCDRVIIDISNGIYLAVERLVKSGRKKIAFLTRDDRSSVAEDKIMCYHKALTDFSLQNRPIVLGVKDSVIEGEVFDAFLFNTNFDALICSDETLAYQSTQHLQRMGLHIPDGVSVQVLTSGFQDKNGISNLSTILVDGKKMGTKVAQMLIERIEKEQFGHSCRTEILRTSYVNWV